MSYLTPLILLTAYICSVAGAGLNATVDASELGIVEGVIENTTAGTEFASFYGMKYADGITGEGRFKPSKRTNGRLNSTGEVFNARQAGPACPQLQVILPVVWAEDCLTINVHSKHLPESNATANALRPVIVYIHGGAFTVGQGSGYNAKFLLERDIVFVTLNYRLGVLGFFSLRNEDVPGNAGLYDIVNGLKWVKDHIAKFGGDPGRVTIAGQSAGSVAVTHMLASPAARGLFHGAIGASGTGLAAWGTSENPINESIRIAEICNCTSSEVNVDARNSEIASCMRSVGEQTLVNALFNFQVEERRSGRLGFAAVSPSIQDFNVSAEFVKVVETHPRDVFEAGKQANVPLLMGCTRHDGSYVLGVYFNRFLKDNGYANATWSNTEFMRDQAVPKMLQALGIPKEYGVYDSIAKMYVGDARRTGEFSLMYPGLIDLFGVFFFKAPSFQTAKYHSSVNRTFWYSFDHASPHTLFPWLYGGGADVPPFPGGITHSDDTIFLFEIVLFSLTGDEAAVRDRVVSYWADFATYGNPGGSNEAVWPALNGADQRYMSIAKESTVFEHYEDEWAGVGWEVVPTTPPPATTDSATEPAGGNNSTEVEGTSTDSSNGAGQLNTSIQFLLSILSLILVQ